MVHPLSVLVASGEHPDGLEVERSLKDNSNAMCFAFRSKKLREKLSISDLEQKHSLVLVLTLLDLP